MDIESIVGEIERRSDPIPLGNSDFQNAYSVVGEQDSPARQYRAALLRARDRLKALKHNQFEQRRNAVRVRQLEAKLAEQQDPYERELMEIDLDDLRDKIKDAEKYVKDAIHELLTLFRIIQAHPEYTREEFEAQELGHFASSLARQVQNAHLGPAAGAAQALMAIQRQDIVGLPPALPEAEHPQQIGDAS